MSPAGPHFFSQSGVTLNHRFHEEGRCMEGTHQFPDHRILFRNVKLHAQKAYHTVFCRLSFQCFVNLCFGIGQEFINQSGKQMFFILKNIVNTAGCNTGFLHYLTNGRGFITLGQKQLLCSSENLIPYTLHVDCPFFGHSNLYLTFPLNKKRIHMHYIYLKCP